VSGLIGMHYIETGSYRTCLTSLGCTTLKLGVIGCVWFIGMHYIETGSYRMSLTLLGCTTLKLGVIGCVWLYWDALNRNWELQEVSDFIGIH